MPKFSLGFVWNWKTSLLQKTNRTMFKRTIHFPNFQFIYGLPLLKCNDVLFPGETCRLSLHDKSDRETVKVSSRKLLLKDQKEQLPLIGLIPDLKMSLPDWNKNHVIGTLAQITENIQLADSCFVILYGLDRISIVKTLPHKEHGVLYGNVKLFHDFDQPDDHYDKKQKEAESNIREVLQKLMLVCFSSKSQLETWRNVEFKEEFAKEDDLERWTFSLCGLLNNEECNFERKLELLRTRSSMHRATVLVSVLQRLLLSQHNPTPVVCKSNGNNTDNKNRDDAARVATTTTETTKTIVTEKETEQVH